MQKILMHNLVILQLPYHVNYYKGELLAKNWF